MAGKAGLKAGLIGAGIMLVLSLLGLISLPVWVGCGCCGVQVLAYVGIGVLAGFFVTPPRTAGAAAGAGAIAGVISGAVGGLVQMIVALTQVLGPGTGGGFSGLNPEMIQFFTDLGVDPSAFTGFAGTAGAVLGGGLCCLTSLGIGAALGAIGGAVLGAAKRD